MFPGRRERQMRSIFIGLAVKAIMNRFFQSLECLFQPKGRFPDRNEEGVIDFCAYGGDFALISRMPFSANA